MGVMTLKIDDELERMLRARAGQIHGAKRGSISASVEDAIRVWLVSAQTRDLGEKRFYVAMSGDKRVAEGQSLGELASKLKEAGIDSRDVTIESQPGLPATRRMGLRTRR